MIPNPWLILAIVVFLLVSHGWAFNAGSEFKSNQIKSDQLEAQNKAIEKVDKQASADNKLENEAARVQEKIKIEYRYIRERVNAEIEKNPAYSECVLGDIGLQFYNARPNSEEKSTGESTN